MTYHLIARADRGGLAQQTVELARHVPPARALVVDLGARGRGPTDPSRYTCPVRVTDGPPDDDDWAWITDGARTIFAAETAYRDDWCASASDRGVRTVLQANPELYVEPRRPDTLVTPTTWEADRLPDADLLAVPVARDRLPERPPEGPVTCWYHPASPAMADRNGTRLVFQALRHVRRRVTVIVRSHETRRERTRRLGPAATLVELPPAADYADAYPAEAQGLLIPRRYGGLCLPMQEAASLGWPIVSLDLEPQRGWLHPEALVPARRGEQRRMRGGDFWVHDCAPRRLAALLDLLAADVDLVAEMVDVSLRWAESLSWERWAGVYRQVLGVAGERAA